MLPPSAPARPTDTDRTLDSIRFFASFERSDSVITVLLLVIAGLLEGVGFAAVLPLLDTMLSRGATADSTVGVWIGSGLRHLGMTPTLGPILGCMVVAFWLKGAIIISAMNRVNSTTAKVIMTLRVRLLRAVVGAEWRHALRYPTGLISNAISREAESSAHTYREFCTMTAELLQVVAYIALATLVSWQTASVAVASGAVVMLVLRGHLSSVRRGGTDQTALLRSISARVSDALPSLKPLKAMGRERYLLPILEGEVSAFFVASQRAERAKEILNRGREPMVVLILSLGLWAVLTYSHLASTVIVVLALLFYRTVTTFTNIQVRWATVRQGESAFESMMSHIRTLESDEERWTTETGRKAHFTRSIRLDHVSFSYGAHEVLRDVTARIDKGRFIVLVGPSGSGKSTMTDILTSLLRPTNGRVLVDDVDLAEVDIRDWRAHVGYVPQDPMLFSDTIRGNIALGAEGISDEAIQIALQDAGAWDFVSRLHGTLDHCIGEGGSSLSGGQRQRLAIARALVTHPRILVLDEPTTALDAVTESEVCMTIAALRGSVTIVAVSHQSALRELADEIWELRDSAVHVLNPKQP